MYILGLFLVFYFGIAYGIELGKPDETNAELKAKLTKAKDIIRRLMHELVISNIPYDDVELLVKDTEQFLKEAEE